MRWQCKSRFSAAKGLKVLLNSTLHCSTEGPELRPLVDLHSAEVKCLRELFSEGGCAFDKHICM